MKILSFNKTGNPAGVLSFTEKEKPASGDIEKPSFELPLVGSFSLEQFREVLAGNARHNAAGKIIFKN